MAIPLQILAKKLKKPFFSENELLMLFPQKSNNSRYGLIKRLLKKGDLIRIRRGLYCLGENWRAQNTINLFSLASVIYAPSYISFESALSYHQWIPEAVYSVTSATTKRTCTFQTPLGDFIYFHLPTFNFYCGVQLIAQNQQSFFIASPLKAICDYIYSFKKDWKNSEPLIDSLRIETELLETISRNEIEQLNNYYKNNRISQFLKGLTRDLSL